MKKTKILLAGSLLLGTIIFSQGLSEAKKVSAEEIDYSLNEITYDFSASNGLITDFSDWGNNYNKHEVNVQESNVFPKSKITFEKANKQAGTITNYPVTKGNYVEFNLLNNNYYIEKATFTCKQWSSKIQTITLNVSNDNVNYTKTNSTSSNFKLSSDSFTSENNYIGLKYTFSSQSNQVGIQSLSIKLGKKTIDESKCNINFENTSIPSQTIDKGTSIDKPVDPTKNGYKFGGWYDSSTYDNEISFPFVVNESITIYARWNNLDITNISECNTEGEYYRITGLVTSNYANKSYSIQDLSGAILLNDSSLLAKSNVGNTISITGKLAKNDDGNLELNTLLELENSDTSLTINPITSLSNITNNDYAKKVSLKNLKIKSITNEVATIYNNDLVKLYAEAKTYTDGYSSSNWSKLYTTNSYINIDGFVNIVNSELRICITKMSKATTYTATFVYNNGNVNTTQIVSEEEKFTRPADPEKDADAKYTYTFDDWYTGENGTGEKYNFDNEPKDIALYANWIKIAKPINETFKDAEIKSNLKFGYTKSYIEADETTYIFTSNSSSGDKMKNGVQIEYSKGNGASAPVEDNTGVKLYCKNTLTLTSEDILKEINIKVNSTKKLTCKNDISVTGAVFKYDDETSVTLTPTSNTITILIGVTKTSGNIQIASITTIGGKISSYSNFNSLQLQYQYTFDVSDAENVEEVGIFVTDDADYKFYATGEFTDDFKFNEMLSKGKHGHTFVNKDKLETYTVGINIPEINLTTTGTTFKACAYVKTNGKYYFAEKAKTLTIESMLEAYMNMTDLDQEAKNVVNAFYDYLLELTSK